jgi:ferredoxin
MVGPVSRGRISAVGRLKHGLQARLRAIGERRLGGRWDLERLHWVTRVPALPAWARRHHREHRWSPEPGPVPEELRTVAGIWRDPAAEEAAYERQPLHAFFQVHFEAANDMLHHGWEYLLPTSPRYIRAIDRLKGARRSSRAVAAATAAATAPARTLTPAELAARVRQEATRLGLSAVGFAPYDPKYSWAEFAPRHERGSVIVCLYEQDYANSQTAPSARAERAAFFAYAELVGRTASLSEFVQGLGGRAQPHGPVGEALVIHYAVQAGLGQLGINGQLLTRAAGSRVRIALITTDVELEHDEPKDFGVHAICDACQVCVRRCPVGAIPAKRAEHRGVTKVKIKTERCFPVVARVEGCAICMKTCPVQKFGLDPVVAHYEATGEILGKGTEALESYRWPLDGRTYGVGEKPAIDSATLVRPEGWVFDGTRVEPPLPVESPAVPDALTREA